MESEEDYFLTTMTSAIDFISNMIDDDLNIEKSEYKDLYNKFEKEKKAETEQLANRREQIQRERNYDEFDNQSEVSIMTTQSHAQILGELQELDIPIIGASLTINKGTQTDNKPELLEDLFDNKTPPIHTGVQVSSKIDTSEMDALSSAFDTSPKVPLQNPIIEENKAFISSLSENFESLTISQLKEMHEIMLNLKHHIPAKHIHQSDTLLSYAIHDSQKSNYDSSTKSQTHKNHSEMLLFSENKG